MKRKSCSASKIPRASRLVSVLVSNACQIMEVIICDKLYQKAEPQSIRNILEWFFLDRRYRHLRLLNGNEELFKIQKLHGGYIVSAEIRAKGYPADKDISCSFRTKSEKEVIRVLESYAETAAEAEIF